MDINLSHLSSASVDYRSLFTLLKIGLDTRVDLSLASWLSWQYLAKFLQHLGNHGSHVQAAATQSKCSFHPTTTISTSFHNRNAETNLHAEFAKNYENGFWRCWRLFCN